MSPIRACRSFFRQPRIKPRTLRRQLRRQRGPVGIALDHGREHLRYVFAFERPAARQHFVEHAPERPHVAALVGQAAFRLLGRHVGAVPRIMPACVAPANVSVGECVRPAAPLSAPPVSASSIAFASPKSSTLTVVVRRDLHVRRLEIAVDDRPSRARLRAPRRSVEQFQCVLELQALRQRRGRAPQGQWRSASVSPSTSSITRKCRPPDSSIP